MNYKSEIEKINLLVIGDIMLDEYFIGDVNRISPEAPVPIVDIKEKYYTLGGCGNVVKNLKKIGCNVDCIAQTAFDDSGEIIREELIKLGVDDKYLITSNLIKKSIKKTRVLDSSQTQLLRIDEEDIVENSIDGFLYFIRNIDYDIYNAIIISDYGKGFINEKLMDFLKTKDIKIIVDPKPKNKHMYDDVFMITPNRQEWKEMKSYDYKNIKYILNTIGRDGMQLIEHDKSSYFHSDPIQVFNVSGAGDTVVSTITCCICLGIDIIKSCKVANQSAQYVIQQPGTSYIPQNLFISFLN